MTGVIRYGHFTPGALDRFARWMAHLKKSASTGHLLKNTSGHLLNDCGGGFTPGEDCDPCDDDTSADQYDITVSGVTICTCSDGGSLVYDTGTDPNGTYRVDQEGSTCVWSRNQGSVDRIQCPSTLDDSTDWKVGVAFSDNGGGGMFVFSELHDGVLTAIQGILEVGNQDCSAGWSGFTITSTSSGDCSNTVGGYGGAISIAAV